MYSCELCEDKNDKASKEVKNLHNSHIICLIHLENHILENFQVSIKCPIENCNHLISQPIIKEILSENDFDEYLIMSLKESLSGDESNIHKCINRLCDIPIIYETSDIQFDCPKCGLYNCISCKASHAFRNCMEYQSLTSSEKLNVSQTVIDAAEAKSRESNQTACRKKITKLDKLDLVKNFKIFKCTLCEEQIQKGKGIQLRQCFHCICKECLRNTINLQESSTINCPMDCQIKVEEREIKAILSPREYENFRKRDLNKTRQVIRNRLCCRETNCENFFERIPEENIENWRCTLCGKDNCEMCDSLHSKQIICPREQRQLDESEAKIKEDIKKKLLMQCLGCKSYLKKVAGCNFIQCPTCQLELCWITQNYRWGPKGRGDTSGGCKCTWNARCHPDCVDSCEPH